MMDNLLERWRKIPYLRSLLIWTLGILLIGDWIGAPYFQSDYRLRFAFVLIATSAISFAHQLIYKRQNLRDLLVSLAIMAPAVVIGMWLSFALFDSKAALGFLPQFGGIIVGIGVYAFVRRKFLNA